MNARLPLSGKDLEEYHRHTREEMEAAKQSSQEELSSSSSSDESEDDAMEVDHSKLHQKKTAKHDFIRSEEKKHKQNFFKAAPKAHLMFPCHVEERKFDDYGEPIRLVYSYSFPSTRLVAIRVA